MASPDGQDQGAATVAVTVAPDDVEPWEGAGPETIWGSARREEEAAPPEAESELAAEPLLLDSGKGFGLQSGLKHVRSFGDIAMASMRSSSPVPLRQMVAIWWGARLNTQPDPTNIHCHPVCQPRALTGHSVVIAS